MRQTVATWRAVLIGTAVAVAAAVPASAQDKPVTARVGAIAVGPLSDSGRVFSPGLGVDIGADWNLTPQIGLKFDAVATALGAQSQPEHPASVPVGVTPRMQFATANVFFQSPPGKARIYVTGGVGVYRRTVELTLSSSDFVTVCNPWWFVCYPGPVPSSHVSGTRSSVDFGVNVGAGFTASHFFAEMRYHFVWGPSYAMPQGQTPASGKFLPIVIGVRF